VFAQNHHSNENQFLNIYWSGLRNQRIALRACPSWGCKSQGKYHKKL